VLNGVGAASIIAPIIGRLVGIKAEVRANHGTTSPESGWIPDRVTIFFRYNSSAYTFEKVPTPFWA
jgi:hypothetical protein